MKYKDYETYVIGIDHGYNNMKTCNFCFPTKIEQRETLPDILTGILQIDGKIYSENGTQVSYIDTFDKTTTEDFYNLTLIAIAKELNKKNVYGGIIKLAVGLPLRYFEKQKDSFKKYLMRKPEVTYKYEGKTYHIFLEDCKVFTQGFAAILTSPNINKYIEDDSSAILCDLGGGTVDFIPIEGGNIQFASCKVSNDACNYLFTLLKEAVVAETGNALPDRVALNYILKGNRNMKPKNIYEEVMQKELIKYADNIKSLFAEFGYNIDLTPVVYEGGGAAIIKNFGDYYESNTEFLTDLSANVKGYEMLYKSIS